MWTPPDQLRSPGVSEPTASPFRVLSQISVTWWALGHLWFSKLNVLGACLSGTCLKSWGDCCGVQTLPSSGRSSGFWVPSWLWVASQLVGFWWDYVPDFSTASTWVFSPIVCLVCRISQFLVSPQGLPPQALVLYLAANSLCLWVDVSPGSSSIVILNRNLCF